MRAALNGIMAHARSAMVEGLSPQIQQILQGAIPALEGCGDYRDPEARAAVDAVLWNLLQFLEFRMETTRGNDYAAAYLFADTERVGSEPKADGHLVKPGKATSGDRRDHFEKELQLDCMRFLRPFLGRNARLEQSDVAGGRADIYIELHRTRLVIEVKREDDDASHTALRAKYGAQATEYSSTSARVSFLLVLDRSGKDGSSGHITSKVSVQTVPKRGDAEPRTLVIVVMPGRRKRPSQQQLRE